MKREIRLPLPEEGFTSSILRETARRVNFVWLLAWIHRRPEALRLLAILASALAPHHEALAVFHRGARKCV
jgi:hypothetical protein